MLSNKNIYFRWSGFSCQLSSWRCSALLLMVAFADCRDSCTNMELFGRSLTEASKSAMCQLKSSFLGQCMRWDCPKKEMTSQSFGRGCETHKSLSRSIPLASISFEQVGEVSLAICIHSGMPCIGKSHCLNASTAY